MDGWTGEEMDGWMGEQMDGLVNGGWMERWVDR